MAIYTRTGYSVLDTKALDAKTYYNSLAEYTADPYKYNGQIAYIKDAVTYCTDNPSVGDPMYASSDSLRLNLPGTNKYLDFFYINSSLMHEPGINISNPSGSINSNLFTLNFDPFGSSPCYIQFASISGCPSICVCDIDYCYTNYSSVGITLYDIGDFSSSLDLHGLNIGNSNSDANFGALIGTGIIPNPDQIHPLIVGQYNDATDPYLFSVGCGIDNSHRRNAITVDANGNTYISDLTADGMWSNGTVFATSVIDSDYLTKNDVFQLNPDKVELHDAFGGLSDGYISGLKMRITEAYPSTAKLNIFLYTNTTTIAPTEYILQNYPIGNLAAGDLVIEDLLFAINHEDHIGATITGTSSTGSGYGLLQYCGAW